MKIVVKPRMATGMTKAIVLPKERGMTKAEAEENPHLHEEKPYSQEVVDDTPDQPGEWGLVKWSNRVGLSLKFQSVHMEAGIELPVKFRHGYDVAQEARRGLDKAQDIVDTKIAETFESADGVLNMIADKYGRR